MSGAPSRSASKMSNAAAPQVLATDAVPSRTASKMSAAPAAEAAASRTASKVSAGIPAAEPAAASRTASKASAGAPVPAALDAAASRNASKVSAGIAAPEPAASLEDLSMQKQTQEGLAACVKFLVTQYLDDSHYSSLHCKLASNWDRLHSLSAAIKLMEHYGVYLSPSELDRLSGLEETQQISALVSKMPEQSNEQFQHFFLQLQLVVSTASRVRQALEAGRSDLVATALDDAESTGISPYILKMAIVQAGTEVVTLKSGYEKWVKDTDVLMGRLVHGQHDAIEAQKKLAAAEAQLSVYTTGQNEKTKKALMAFAGSSDSVLRATFFKEWHLIVLREREEKEIRREFEERISIAEQKLVEFKAKQLEGVRSMLNKKAAQGDNALKAEVLRLMKDVVEEAKFFRENEANIRELESKLNDYKDASKANTKAVMARMTAEGDNALVSMCWQALVAYHKDYLKNKDFEDAVKASEKQLQEYMKQKKDGAKGLLAKVGEGADTVLLGEAMQAWVQLYVEEKKSRELEEILNSGQGKFASFGDRNSKNARGVCDRARIILEQSVYLRTFGAWRLFSTMEATQKKYHHKIEGKKQQLLGVQNMFRNFAQQLESTIKDGDSSREKKYNMKMDSVRSLKKSQQTSSLPNIHGKA